jgi:hypothetical protein
MSYSSATSWKNQSNRIKTGNMSFFNNEYFYGDYASFNFFESKNGIFKDISSNSGQYLSLSSTDGTFNNMRTNYLYISNLGQNAISTDRYVNVDSSNQLICVDLSASGNYTSYGGHTMLRNKTAWGTTAIGYDAIKNISTRTDISFANTAVGTNAMRGIDASYITGKNNSAFGNSSMMNIYTGNENSSFGNNSLKCNKNGNGNTAVGSGSLCNSTTADNNTAIGYNSLNLNTTGQFNVGIGVDSMKSNISGSYNSSGGVGSLNTNSTGQQNAAFGTQSLFANTFGCNNSAFGYNSLRNNVDASENTAIGSYSLALNTRGRLNVAVGSNTLTSDISGSFNTVVGANSDVTQIGINSNNQILGYNNKSNFSNVNMIGTNMTNNIGANRTFINNINTSTNSTLSNIMICDTSTNQITYATDIIKKVAADASGIYNIQIGSSNQNFQVMRDFQMANDGVMYLTGDKQFALWRYDFSHIYIGHKNGLLSGDSLFTMDNLGNSSTQGYGSFYINNDGGTIIPNGHVYIRNRKKIYLTDAQNFSIGAIDDNNIYFGLGYANGDSNLQSDNAGNISTNGSGKTTVNSTQGLYVTQLAGPMIAVGVGTNGVLTRGTTSDPSLKKNVVPLSSVTNTSELLNKLNPVNFEWIDPSMGTGVQYGFLANEVQKLFPNIISHWDDASGNRKLTYDPFQLIPVAIHGVQKLNGDMQKLTGDMQKLNGEVSSLQKENTDLKEEVASLHSIVNKLAERISVLESTK